MVRISFVNCRTSSSASWKDCRNAGWFVAACSLAHFAAARNKVARRRPGSACAIPYPAGENLLHGGYQIVRYIALCNPSAGPGIARLVLNDRRVVLADDDYCGLRHFLANGAGRFEAVHARHGYIHQDDVRAKPAGQLDRFESIGRFAADQPIAATAQNGSYAPPGGLVIVCDNDADRHRSWSPRLSELSRAADLIRHSSGRSLLPCGRGPDNRRSERKQEYRVSLTA